MRVLCCGSRGWQDYERIGQRIYDLPDGAIVIHGGARGADSHSASFALGRGLFTARVDCHNAHWNRYGKSAGLRRTDAMLDLNPELVIAFSLGTPGTTYTIEQARFRDIPLEVIKP